MTNTTAYLAIGAAVVVTAVVVYVAVKNDKPVPTATPRVQQHPAVGYIPSSILGSFITPRDM